MKEDEGTNFQFIHNYVVPVISFYKINDIVLNPRKLNRLMPPKIRLKKNGDYTQQEIQKLLDNADERMPAVILLLVSSRCRIGSSCNLHVGELEKVGNAIENKTGK